MITNFTKSLAGKEKARILEGVLNIELSGPDGVRVPYFTRKNVITLPSKQQILSTIYLPDVVSDPIDKLWIGTGGSVDSLGLFPKAVDETMEGLFTPLTFVTTTYVETLSIPAVTFLADLDQSQANGMIINEAGLYKVSGEMFNIKTFPGIAKTSEFNVHFAWTIQMA